MSLATSLAGAVARPWVLPVAGIVLAGLLSALAAQSYRVNSYRSELATEKSKAAEIRAAGFEAGQKQAAADLEVAQRVNANIGRTLDEERTKSAAAVAAAASAVAAADRLRDRAAALAARCAAPSQGAPAAGGGPSPDAPGLVLADMLRRLEQDGRRASDFAERALIAAETCTAYSDALEPMR